MAKIDNDVLIAFGLFGAWITEGKPQADIPEKYNSPELQAFYAGMMAREHYFKDGGNKEVH